MIDDRAPSVASVKDSGNQLISGLDDKEKKNVSSELKSLEKRWDTVSSDAMERMKTLESMVDNAKQFQDLHENLSIWLDVTEKKFSALEPKTADPVEIERLIGELKVSLEFISHLYLSFSHK